MPSFSPSRTKNCAFALHGSAQATGTVNTTCTMNGAAAVGVAITTGAAAGTAAGVETTSTSAASTGTETELLAMVASLPGVEAGTAGEGAACRERRRQRGTGRRAIRRRANCTQHWKRCCSRHEPWVGTALSIPDARGQQDGRLACRASRPGRCCTRREQRGRLAAGEDCSRSRARCDREVDVTGQEPERERIRQAVDDTAERSDAGARSGGVAVGAADQGSPSE